MAQKYERDEFAVQEFLRHPYPVTPLQIRNAVETDSALLHRAEARDIAMREALNQADLQAAQVQFESDTKIGAIVKPSERFENLRGYKWVLRKDGGAFNVEFSPRGYSSFDGIIAKKSGLDERGNPVVAAFNTNHERYQDFAPLRRNIALLRNYLMTQMFEDGKFLDDGKTQASKEDLARYKALNEMAEHLGDALASKTGGAPSLLTRWGRTMGHLVKGEDLATPYTNEFLKAANIPDKGALVMYNYLKGLQEEPKYDSWPLLPRDQTPFSDENLRLYSRSSLMTGVADAYEENVMRVLRAPENLKVEDQVTSVALARDILERLKNLMASSDEREKTGKVTDEDHDSARKLLQVATGFRDSLALIAEADPEAIQNNKIIAQSFEALEKLGFRMKVEAHKMLVQEYEPTAAKEMQQSIDNTPERYKASSASVSSEALLEQVGSGLKELERIQSQARIAQRIAQKAAERAIRRAQMQSQQTGTARDAMAKARAASTGGKMDDMAGARISGANNPVVARIIREAQEREAPVLTDPTYRGR